MEIRQSRNHLISAIGFIILVKQHLYTLPNKVGGGILEYHIVYIESELSSLLIYEYCYPPPPPPPPPTHTHTHTHTSSSGFKDSYLKIRCSRNRIVFIIGNPMLGIHLYIETTLRLSDTSFLYIVVPVHPNSLCKAFPLSWCCCLVTINFTHVLQGYSIAIGAAIWVSQVL